MAPSERPALGFGSGSDFGMVRCTGLHARPEST